VERTLLSAAVDPKIVIAEILRRRAPRPPTVSLTVLPPKQNATADLLRQQVP